LLSCSGYTAWVIGDACVKIAGEKLSPLEILPINLFISSLAMIAMASLHGGVGQLKTKRVGFHIWRSLFVLGAIYGSFAAIVNLTLADFYTIAFTSPLLVTLLGSLFLKESVDLGSWLAIIFGFAGVLVAVQFSALTGHVFSMQGILAAVFAQFCFTLAMLTARGAGSENNYSLSFWPQVIGCVISTAAVLIWGHIVIDTSAIAFAVLTGVMGAVGIVLTNASLRIAPIAVVSPYHYTQIVGGAILGYLIWHHVPSAAVLLGATMIILSGLYILHAERARSRAKPQRQTLAESLERMQVAPESSIQ